MDGKLPRGATKGRGILATGRPSIYTPRWRVRNLIRYGRRSDVKGKVILNKLT